MDRSQDISLVFADGEAVHFAPLDGESILVSAEKAGNLLAKNCREGTCRTCAARGRDGEEVLLCIAPARPGLSLTLPYNRTDVVPPSLRRAKINSFSRVSRSVWEIRYRLQFPLPFLAGQYVEANFPGIDGARRFSMANAPTDKEQVLHVRDIPGGGMSRYLNERAKPEDAFNVRGPFGVFYRRATSSPKLFVAGGTGLAPILSMLRDTPTGAEAPPLAVVAGFAAGDDAYAVDELRALSRNLPLEIVVSADVGGQNWRGVIGSAVEAIKVIRTVPRAVGTEAYLCGPPGMVAAAITVLIAAGLATHDIFNEEFLNSWKMKPQQRHSPPSSSTPA